VPFGEYFPVPAFVRNWMRLMSLPNSDFAAGSDTQAPLAVAGQTLAPTICYEDAYGVEQLALVRKSSLLVNVSNDAWFGDSTAPHQHLDISRMRALEAGRPMLRATNDGVTALIEHDGRILATLPQFQPGVLTGLAATAHRSDAVYPRRQRAGARADRVGTGGGFRGAAPLARATAAFARGPRMTEIGGLTREGALFANPARELEYLPGDPPESGPRARDRARSLVAACAAADGAQPHQHLAARGRARLDRRRHRHGGRRLPAGVGVVRSHRARRADRCGASSSRTIIPITWASRRGSRSAMARKCGCPRGGHESSQRFLRMSPTELQTRTADFLASHGMEVDSFRSNTGGRDHRTWFGGLVDIDGKPGDGTVLQMGGGRWRAIETAGHCSGHLCLHDAERALLISGDQVLPQISPNVSVLASAPEADPLREFLSSLERLRRCGADTLVLPSHGRPFRGLQRRIDALTGHHHRELDKLREFYREPHTANDALPILFGRVLRGIHKMLALGEALAHLHYLRADGEIERYEEGGVFRFVRT
jgi:glyoxylase-like metal-dependent hydrolase (beta-lactamase superfamily II)